MSALAGAGLGQTSEAKRVYHDIRRWAMSVKLEREVIQVVNLVTKQCFEIEVDSSENVGHLREQLMADLDVAEVRIFFPHSRQPYTRMTSKVLPTFKEGSAKVLFFDTGIGSISSPVSPTPSTLVAHLGGAATPIQGSSFGGTATPIAPETAEAACPTSPATSTSPITTAVAANGVAAGVAAGELGVAAGERGVAAGERGVAAGELGVAADERGALPHECPVSVGVTTEPVGKPNAAATPTPRIGCGWASPTAWQPTPGKSDVAMETAPNFASSDLSQYRDTQAAMPEKEMCAAATPTLTTVPLATPEKEMCAAATPTPTTGPPATPEKEMWSAATPTPTTGGSSNSPTAWQPTPPGESDVAMETPRNFAWPSDFLQYRDTQARREREMCAAATPTPTIGGSSNSPTAWQPTPPDESDVAMETPRKFALASVFSQYRDTQAASPSTAATMSEKDMFLRMPESTSRAPDNEETFAPALHDEHCDDDDAMDIDSMMECFKALALPVASEDPYAPASEDPYAPVSEDLYAEAFLRPEAFLSKAAESLAAVAAVGTPTKPGLPTLHHEVTPNKFPAGSRFRLAAGGPADLSELLLTVSVHDEKMLTRGSELEAARERKRLLEKLGRAVKSAPPDVVARWERERTTHGGIDEFLQDWKADPNWGLLLQKESKRTSNLTSQERLKRWKTKFELIVLFGEEEAKNMIAFKTKTKGMTRKDPNCPTQKQYALFVDEEKNKVETESLSKMDLNIDHTDVSPETAAHLAALTSRMSEIAAPWIDTPEEPTDDKQDPGGVPTPEKRKPPKKTPRAVDPDGAPIFVVDGVLDSKGLAAFVRKCSADKATGDVWKAKGAQVQPANIGKELVSD